MTERLPHEASAEPLVERRSGYVTFDVLLAAMEAANRPITQAIERQAATLTREIEHQTHTLAARLERHELEAARRDARIDALELWRREEELEQAARESFKKTTLRVLRWLIEQWPALTVIGATIVGLAWVIVSGGQPGIEVRP
ncbi:MAG TPA: hypothetical protein VFH63_04040 [candidate division Zixibacteria bacterium]|nr:hypothetical protein [candidate division Zixibacteria bacterium]